MIRDINFAIIQDILWFTNCHNFFKYFCTENHENCSFANAHTTSKAQITQVSVSEDSLWHW